MTMTHLLYLTTKFIELWVLMLSRLAMKVPDLLHICSAVLIHTRILVILNMKHWDTYSKFIDKIR